MKINWSEHYLMGLDMLDNDHKRLFQIAEKIVNAVNDTRGMDERTRIFVVREGVKYLKTYFADHAAREEAYMRKIGYADYEAHKRLHDEFQSEQLARFERITERDTCTRDEVFDFIGAGIGWLLEHIATADMAIVGKGVLCRPAVREVNEQAVVEEVNRMFIATLNMKVNADILSLNYGGENFGEAVYQKFVYERQGQEVTVIAGIEKAFLVKVAQSVYGEDLTDADALVLSSLEIFGANFWRTLGERLARPEKRADYREGHFLSRQQVRTMFDDQQPAVSVLFGSDKGKFFIASNDLAFAQRSTAGLRS